MILIGSHALKIKCPNFIFENNRMKDYDFICLYQEYKQFVKNNIQKIKKTEIFSDKKIVVFFKSGSICEFELCWDESEFNQIFENIDSFGFHKETINSEDFLVESYIPTIEFLYILKMSHRYLKNSPHFLKTMNDILKMREIIDVKNIDVRYDLNSSFFKQREKNTYTYGHPVLNTTKKSFFKDDVPYIYDHDSIHEAVKHLEKPAYEYYKSDNKEVLCSKNKFYELPELIRLYGVLEEVYVLALERSQIHNVSWTPIESFKYALIKVCTSITSGWFREYAWENYHNVLNMYDDSYVKRFFEKVESGLVKKYDC